MSSSISTQDFISETQKKAPHPVRHIRTNIVKARKYSQLIDPKWALCYADYIKDCLKLKVS